MSTHDLKPGGPIGKPQKVWAHAGERFIPLKPAEPEGMERFFASPLVARMALNATIFLAVVLVVSVVFAATKTDRPSTVINPCALVLTRESGPECR